MTNNNQANQVTSLEAALRYSRMGYYPIPIRRDTKKPAIKFANKPRLTADEIKSIWGAHPEYNVALRTVNHMCIDIDIGHETGVSGYDSIKPLLEEPWWPKETLTATTATGGKHYIFAKPADVELTQNIGALPGVDIKANINNYHLVFPSTNSDGKMYNWDNWNKYSNVKPTEAPIELCEKLGAIKGNTHKCQIVENSKPNDGSHRMLLSGTGAEKTASVFETLAYGLGNSGVRNTNLTRLVGYLLRLGVESHAVLYLASMSNGNTSEPLSEAEFLRTFESILERHLLNKK